MVALLLALAGPVLAAEPALEVARGEAALAEGDARAAYAHAREAVRADLDDWRAVRLWLRSGDALGLSGMVEAEVWGLSQRSGSLRVAHAWTRVADRDMAAEALAAPGVRRSDPQLAALAMADQAQDRGFTELALTLLEGHADAEAVRVRLDALLTEGRNAEAARLAREAWDRHPEHPDVLRPLLQTTDRDKALRKARKALRTQLLRRAEQVDDPLLLWRARAALVGIDDAGTARVSARLRAIGEPARLDRVALPDSRMQALALWWSRDPARIDQLPALTRAELGVVAQRMVEVLDRSGQRAAVLPALDGIRARVDSVALAVRHAEALVEAGDTDAALKAANVALRLAAGPAPDDVGRVERGRHEAELAAGLGIRGRIRLESGDALGAAFDLVTAGRLSGAVADPLADLAVAQVGDLPRLERQSPDGVHPLDAALEVAADRAVDDPATGAELARRVALVPADSARVERRRLARAWGIAGDVQERDPLVRAVIAAVLAPEPRRLGRAAVELALAGEDDAAFVAWSVVRGQGAPAPGLLEAWRGVGSADDAADVLAALWTDAAPDRAVTPGTFADIGDVVPDRVLTTTEGRLPLGDLRGSVVVLNLWASWCGPCAVELPRLDQLVTQLKSEGLAVELLAVSTDDSREAWLDGTRELGLGGAIMAWDRELGLAVGAVTVPLTLIVDRDGVIQSRYLGWSEEHMPAVEQEIRVLATP